MITGGCDYMLKLSARDMTYFRQIMADKISTLPHMMNIYSHVSIEALIGNNFAHD